MLRQSLSHITRRRSVSSVSLRAPSSSASASPRARSKLQLEAFFPCSLDLASLVWCVDQPISPVTAAFAVQLLPPSSHLPNSYWCRSKQLITAALYGGFSGRIGGAFVRTSFRSSSPAVHAIPERGFLPEYRQILTARVIIDVPRRSEKAGQVFYRRRSDDSPPTGVGRGVAPVVAAERSCRNLGYTLPSPSDCGQLGPDSILGICKLGLCLGAMEALEDECFESAELP
ncbi:hypothetical protein HPB47_000433 [Ixodes persulcatus]|uniref:Uncharacterized protein n=1 Tax=Ixodes persulcatus TaxID=34615 RepID=A0AC60PSJ3_IXOPE|nr:hypothetical protein HPB47_000433 [Ixodes persulcatus]